MIPRRVSMLNSGKSNIALFHGTWAVGSLYSILFDLRVRLDESEETADDVHGWAGS